MNNIVSTTMGGAIALAALFLLVPAITAAAQADAALRGGGNALFNATMGISNANIASDILSRLQFASLRGGQPEDESASDENQGGNGANGENGTSGGNGENGGDGNPSTGSGQANGGAEAGDGGDGADGPDLSGSSNPTTFPGQGGGDPGTTPSQSSGGYGAGGGDGGNGGAAANGGLVRAGNVVSNSTAVNMINAVIIRIGR